MQIHDKIHTFEIRLELLPQRLSQVHQVIDMILQTVGASLHNGAASFNIFRLSTNTLMAWTKVRLTCRMIGMEL